VKEKDEEWVEVASVGQDDEAELIAGFLDAQGIPSEVEGPSMSPFPEDIGGFGASRVMVPPDRAEEAKAALARREKEFAAQGDEEEDSAERDE
jgi:hypothetical protein